jgi:antitoxin ParD1/3/4
MLANFCQSGYIVFMSTMNISLPDSLRTFVEEQVSARGYGTSSEYVRELIRKDLDRQNLRDLLLKGASSELTASVNAQYFQDMRERVLKRD